jgi:hypothetical protein
MKWAQKKRGTIEFFFEDGATHRSELKRLLKANGDVVPIFLPKERMVQFQAADLLAWKSRKILAGCCRIRWPT